MRTRAPAPTAPVPSLRESLECFRRLVVLIRPYWGGMFRGLVLSLVVGSIGLVAPYFSKLYFDKVYPARDISLMHALVLGVAAFSLASSVMSSIRNYYNQVVSTQVGRAVSLMYFNHLQQLPIRFFDEHRVGEIMSRLGDMRGALGTVARVFQTILVNGVYLVLVPPFLLALSWKLSMISLIATPLTVSITTATSRITRRFMKRTAEANAEVNAIQVEALSQIRTLKAMAAEPFVFRDVLAQTEEATHLQLRSAVIGTVIGVGNTTIHIASTALFTWYAWTLILRGDLTLGSFMAFTAYLGYLTGPVGQVASLFADFQQSAVTLGRAFEYLDFAPEQDPETAYSIPAPVTRPIRGEIVIDRVSFGYAADKMVLRDVSMSFVPGQVTALVGASGAGKSTILRLLCGMERATAGYVRVDGRGLETYPLPELRRQIGVVWQEPTLLRGTIWENLTLGLEDVSRDTVTEAVRACQLEALITELPNGYDTVVAEWGATLSGGQRQRFALARALVRNTPVLLLDETTSQVDVRTEEEILRAVLPRIRDKTVVLVTHRMATASLADQICVLENGRVVGAGTHDELAGDNPAYRTLVQAAHAGDDNRRLRMLGVT